ncbi:unnamed protein product, partial [Rotaria magnacalcarata]
IQGQSSNSEKSEGDYLHNLFTGQATIDSRDLQTEETAILSNISHDKSTPISLVQTPPLLFVSPTSSVTPVTNNYLLKQLFHIVIVFNYAEN